MSDVAIRVDGLGKRYHLGGERQPYATLGEQVRRWATLRPLRHRAAPPPPFWALKDVGFEVEPGEVVGIIGRNGAGKSTLLKILSRITEPTEGAVDLYGRVGSLLEVGTGFHPELTGRENIALNGAILGMGRREVRTKFDEIVAFAEVEKFIDTPVKHYSSGMYTRLAFAVAAHLEPEILIVDEVLAVGDAAFQQKCLGKMGEVARGGRTVLFVSHNMSAVQRLCGRALHLRAGRAVELGPTREVIHAYLVEGAVTDRFARPAQPTGQPTLTAGVISQADAADGLIRFELEVTAAAAGRVSLDMRLADEVGNPVGFGSFGALAQSDSVTLAAGPNRLVVGLRTDRLALGGYVVGLDLTHPEVAFYDRLDEAFKFTVERPPAAGRDRVHPQSWGYGSYELPLERLAT